jgi:hypothetical protein
MHIWTQIRRLVLTKEKSKREVCREFSIHWKTLEKILFHEGSAKALLSEGHKDSLPAKRRLAWSQQTGIRAGRSAREGCLLGAQAASGVPKFMHFHDFQRQIPV